MPAGSIKWACSRRLHLPSTTKIDSTVGAGPPLPYVYTQGQKPRLCLGPCVTVPNGPAHQLQELVFDFTAEASRCRLKPVFASTEEDVRRLVPLAQCTPPCVILCDVTTRATLMEAPACST